MRGLDLASVAGAKRITAAVESGLCRYCRTPLEATGRGNQGCPCCGLQFVRGEQDEFYGVTGWPDRMGGPRNVRQCDHFHPERRRD